MISGFAPDFYVDVSADWKNLKYFREKLYYALPLDYNKKKGNADNTHLMPYAHRCKGVGFALNKLLNKITGHDSLLKGSGYFFMFLTNMIINWMSISRKFRKSTKPL